MAVIHCRKIFIKWLRTRALPLFTQHVVRITEYLYAPVTVLGPGGMAGNKTDERTLHSCGLLLPESA
jgi:hypothetical protein